MQISGGFVCFALNFLALFCLLAGLDASAQTTSHELTIPNDVSIVNRVSWDKKEC